MQSVKKGAAIIIRFRLGSAGVDIDDPQIGIWDV